MKYSYLLFTILSLFGFIACNDCETCDDLYYEPTIKVVFLDSPFRAIDTIKVTIKSLNGFTSPITNKGGKDSSFINRKRATYFFPLKMDTVAGPVTTTFAIQYLVYKRDTIVKDTLGRKTYTVVYDSVRKDITRTFSINYQLEPYFYNDRRLLRAIIDSTYSKDVSVSCNQCYHTNAQINIYEN